MKTLDSSISISLALLFTFTGCTGISNLRPTNNTTVPSGPVTMSGEFRSNRNNSLRIEVDGVDQTIAFNPVYSTAPGTFSATMNLAPGSHTLRASGDFTQYILIFPSGSQFMSEQVTFTVAGPTLSFSPASADVAVAGTTPVRITLSQAQSGPVTVNLSSSPAGLISHQATVVVPANSTTSPTIPLSGQTAGDATLSANSPGFTASSATIAVNPGLTAIAPTQGPTGTTVTFTGSGFVAGATTVRFGNNNATAVTVASPTSLTATVPAGLPNGNQNAVVTVAGNNSVSRTFTVTAAPPVAPAAVLFRTSAQDVQTFTFTPASGATPASLALVDTDNATAQGGVYTVGIAQTATRVVRSSPVDAQSFTVATTPLSISLQDTQSGGASGTGSAIAISGSTVVRAIDVGVETTTLNAAGDLGTFASAGGTISATGVAVDIRGTVAVRAHSTGIDLFDVSNPAGPVRLSGPGTGGGDASAVGTGVRFINATRVVRSFPQGVEVYDISNTAAPSRLTVNRTGFVDSAMGTAVAVEPGATAIIRAHSTGLERYPLPLSATAAPTTSTGARVSTTGVGVIVVGTRAFRATNDRVEAYNLPALGMRIADIAATVSSVGVSLTGR